MYHMKNIITPDDALINIPKSMYSIKNPYGFDAIEDINVKDNILNKVIKFSKKPNKEMIELEERQNYLLEKLETLYNRVKCMGTVLDEKTKETTKHIPSPEEVVLVINTDNMPWFINIINKNKSSNINFFCHIHSSVPKEKVKKINSLLHNLNKDSKDITKINFRLIFKNESADPELKISSLASPIIGYVNILRYLSFIYPAIIPYDHENYRVDSLLDVCHLLEKVSDKDKEPLFKKICSSDGNWILNTKEYTIVDIAAFNVIKNSQYCIKFVNKDWFKKCEKLC